MKISLKSDIFIAKQIINYLVFHKMEQEKGKFGIKLMEQLK